MGKLGSGEVVEAGREGGREMGRGREVVITVQRVFYLKPSCLR